MSVETRLRPRRLTFRAVTIWAGLMALFGAMLEESGPRSPSIAPVPLDLVAASLKAPVPSALCAIFPSNNIWNADISRVPVHPKSSIWLASMKASSSFLHPAFGRRPYGMPYATVGNLHPRVRVTFEYKDESDPGPYPFGLDIPLELNEDRHALMLNTDACVLYELYRADWNNGFPRAGSGAIFSLGSNRLRPNGWTSADAAGLPIFAGLIRYDEVMAGSINHAIRFITPRTDCQHVWPARHHDRECGSNYPPMGARFRLNAGYNISPFSPPVRVILKAMKQYGMIIADNGPNWYVWGTMDQRWTDTILSQLKTVPASAFQVVNQSVCMVDPNSGQARCP